MKTNHHNIIIGIVLITIAIYSCKTQQSNIVDEKFPKFFNEGHRGTRGLLPENTIPSMLKAVEDGANVLELDVHISKDNKVIVAHDPYVNPKFTVIPEDHGYKLNDKGRIIFYSLDYNDIKTFDVGSKTNEEFPDQRSVKAHIPLLSEMIDAVESYTQKSNKNKIIYNVEIKSNPKMDGVNHPNPDEIVRLVMEVLQSKKLNDRYYIQSFDIRQIKAVKEKYPDVPVGYLTGDGSKSFTQTIETIGFRPEIFSPHYKIASVDLVKEVQAKGSKFIPWTVNTEEDIKDLLAMNVDGIITDYPGLLTRILDNR